MIREGRLEGQRWQRLAGRGPIEDRMTLYAPLRAPELVIELAELAEKKIMPEDVLGWAQVYGLLGLPDEDKVSTYHGCVTLRIKGAAQRESVGRFAEAAGEIKACLRIGI